MEKRARPLTLPGQISHSASHTATDRTTITARGLDYWRASDNGGNRVKWLGIILALLGFWWLILPRLVGSRLVLGKTESVYFDMNQAIASPSTRLGNEQVLVLTPLKDAAAYIDEYFHNLDQLTYPKHLISLAFLVSDTTDNTIELLQKKAAEFSRRLNPKNRYKKITILQRDFHFELPNEHRHRYELQPTRRSFLARARNYLLTAALNEEHSWVLWLDADVVKYDRHILEDFMSVDKDVLVPNCLWYREDDQFWAYDKNNWQETELSLEMLRTVDKDFILVEGYYEFPTNRLYMVDMPTHLGRLVPVPLDGVGATFTLVKAHVHREGANFPTYPFEHQIETEGFAKMAKKMGFEVAGLPGYIIFHAMNH